MPVNLLFHTTSDVLQNNDLLREQLKNEIGGFAGSKIESIKPITFNQEKNIELSYRLRIDMVALAANRICDVLEFRDHTNKKLQNKLGIFREYITDLKKQYENMSKDIKSNQARYLEYVQQVEFALIDQIIPLTKKIFPEKNKNPKKLARELLSQADMYEVFAMPRPILSTITPDQDQYLVQIEIPQPPLNAKMIKEFLNTKSENEKEQPAWYRYMPTEEKIFFDYSMRNVTDEATLAATISSISSRHRSIPGVANFSRHVLATLDSAGNLTRFHDHYRSSIVASRDLLKLKMKDTEKKLLCLEVTVGNIEKIIEEFLNEKYKDINIKSMTDEEIAKIPILLQTLVSPLKIGPIKREPDYSLYQEKLRAIEYIKDNGCHLTIKGNVRHIRFTNLLSTNHPLNQGRHIIGTGMILEQNPEINQESIPKIIELANDNKTVLGMEAAAEDLEKLYATKIRGLDNNQREMHLAALEEFIISRLGLSHSTCISGKDRKALELIYVDAMEKYYAQHKKLPKYEEADPQDRQNFVDIYADLYLTFHQQMNAGQNAPGAEAIKTPDAYLPKDIRMAIITKSSNRQILNESNRIAENNEYKKLLDKAKRNITPEKKAVCREAFYTLASATLPPDEFTDIVKALNRLKNHIAASNPDHRLIGEINKQIEIIKHAPHLKSLADRVNEFKNMLVTPRFSEKLDVIKGMEDLPGAGAGANALTQFQYLCGAAVTALENRNTKDRKFRAISPHVEAVVVPIKLLNAGESQAVAIERIAKELLNVPAREFGVKAGLRIEASKDNTPANIIHLGEMRVCKIVPEEGEEKMGYVETVQTGRLKSAVYQIPDRLRSDKIWEGCYFKDDAHLPEAGELFKKILEREGFSGTQKTLESTILTCLRQAGVPYANLSEVAKRLADAYVTARDQAIYDNHAGDTSWPCDDLIKLAMSQVEGLKKIRPNGPITITKSFSESYVKLVLLYAKVQGYEVKNTAAHYKDIKMPADNEVEKFRAFLLSQPGLKYHDLRSTKQYVDSLTSEQRKLVQ